MSGSSRTNLTRRVVPRSCFFAAVTLSALLFASVSRPDQPAAEVVGAIEGADITIKGPISVEVANGSSRMMLSNGSEVTVKSGQARIDLVEGGAIGICGPAHLSLLKTSGVLTVALDSGSIHAQLGLRPALAVYTPLIIARPVETGGGHSDILVGLKPGGGMCVRAVGGAARIEQQLTGQSVLVPQGGEASLADGEIKLQPTGETGCDCEILAAKADPPVPPERKEGAALASAKDVRPSPLAPQPVYSDEAGNGNGKLSGPPAVDEPVYKVFMPPLSFDASSPAPPPGPSLATILLVRTVRVRPSVVFRGHVEPARETSAAKPQAVAVQTAVAPPPAATKASQQKPSVMTKMKNFFRRLWK